jgi:hypothetical protein
MLQVLEECCSKGDDLAQQLHAYCSILAYTLPYKNPTIARLEDRLLQEITIRVEDFPSLPEPLIRQLLVCVGRVIVKSCTWSNLEEMGVRR